MQSLSLEQWHDLSGVLVNIVLFLGAIGAVIKFGVFNVLERRWRSELACSHYELPDSSVIFTVDYTVHNTGERPLRLNEVTIRLAGVREVDSLLEPDEGRVIAMRHLRSGDPTLKGLFQIEPGERTIYTLRARLPALDDAVFVLCSFSSPQKRTPGAYRGFYVKSGLPKLKQVELL